MTLRPKHENVKMKVKRKCESAMSLEQGNTDYLDYLKVKVKR